MKQSSQRFHYTMDWYDQLTSFSFLSLQDNSLTGVYWRYDGDGVHDIMRRVGFAL